MSGPEFCSSLVDKAHFGPTISHGSNKIGPLHDVLHRNSEGPQILKKKKTGNFSFPLSLRVHFTSRLLLHLPTLAHRWHSSRLTGQTVRVGGTSPCLSLTPPSPCPQHDLSFVSLYNGSTTSLPLPTTPPLPPRPRRRHGHPRRGGHRRPLHLLARGTHARPLLGVLAVPVPAPRLNFAPDLRVLVIHRRNAALALFGPGSLRVHLLARAQSWECSVKWEFSKGFRYQK